MTQGEKHNKHEDLDSIKLQIRGCLGCLLIAAANPQFLRHLHHAGSSGLHGRAVSGMRWIRNSLPLDTWTKMASRLSPSNAMKVPPLTSSDLTPRWGDSALFLHPVVIRVVCS